MQKAKKKALGGTTTSSGETSSRYRPKDETPKSLTKESNGEDGSVELEASEPEQKRAGDERTLGDAFVPPQPERDAAQKSQTPEDMATEAAGRDDSLERSITIPRTRGSLHGRQPSLSIQSKMRSDSFRRTSTAGPLSPSLGSEPLPTLIPDSETMTDIYRKQASRLEELENENKRLEREVKEGNARWRRSEEELDELREASGEASALKAQAVKAEEARAEITKLNTEIAALQRQLQQRGHSHSISKSIRTPSIPTTAELSRSPDGLRKEIESKDSVIADMELEISRLRRELSTKTSSCDTHICQITALQHTLTTTQDKLRSVEGELADAKKALTRASEKAVKEGVEKTSSDTKMKALVRELAEASAARDEIVRKAENLEKKIETMSKLHREVEARNASKLSAAEMQGREMGVLKARLIAAENENLKLREERDTRKKREISAADDEGLAELEDENRERLERRVRELEGEIFDLKRGVWRDRRKDMQPDPESDTDGPPNKGDAGGFDEIDLSGSGPLSHRRGHAVQSSQQKHSSFSTVLSSGLAAFRGSPEQTARARHDSILQEFDDESAFNENAIAIAQREEEARKMVEHVREVKRKLRDWEGWRLDLVDARRNAAGILGAGFGEIFEV